MAGTSPSDDVSIIIDNGTGMIKAGLSSNERPTAFIPTLCGEPREFYAGEFSQSQFFGESVEKHRMKLKTMCPIENGIIHDFDRMEDIWNYTFEEALCVNTKRHPVMITEPPLNPTGQREKTLEMMFELWETPAVNLATTGILALYSTGSPTGLVLDCGEGVSYALPVNNGYGDANSISKTDYGGRDLNTLFAKLLSKQGVVLAKSSQMHAVRIMKERHCFLALDTSREEIPVEPVQHELPDGMGVLTLDNELWKVPEALFTTSLLSHDQIEGVHELVWKSAQATGICNTKELLSKIYLVGGSTMFKGFSERLKFELRKLVPPNAAASVQIHNAHRTDNREAVWNGGQILANLPLAGHQEQWIYKRQYEENGASIVNERNLMRYK